VTLTARGWLLLDRLAVDMDALAQTQAPGPESALAPIAGGTPGWSRDS
jgi:hypothetical protein